MKETKNKVSKGTTGTKQKTAKVEKGHAEHEAVKTLMEATKKKLANLAPDIETCPKSKYVGYKFNGRLLSSIAGKKLSFSVSIHEYGEKGHHTSTESFEIKSGGKDTGVVITGLLGQVKKNYDVLKEASKPKKTKKAEAKKEAPAAPAN